MDPPPPPGKKPRKRAGKAPYGTAWQVGARQTPPECIALASAVAWATNTGLLCDGLRAIDFDLDEQPLLALCHRLAVDMLGATIVRTRENSPRCLLVYRAAEGEPGKRVITGASQTKTHACKIEVLGRGQQFVAYGRHPSGAELQWHQGGPADVALADVPVVTEAQVTAFLDAAAEIIDAQPVKPEKPKRDRAAGTRPDGLPAGETSSSGSMPARSPISVPGCRMYSPPPPTGRAPGPTGWRPRIAAGLTWRRTLASTRMASTTSAASTA